MSDSPAPGTVVYQCQEDGPATLEFDDALLSDQILDYDSVPETARSGQMRKLLCASALGCFAGSARAALQARGATIGSLRGTAQATTGQGDGGSRVTAIDIRVEVQLGDADDEAFAKVEKILRKGCLITRSLTPGITVTHNLVRL